MRNIFSRKTILATLIGTGIVSGLVALPAQKNANDVAGLTTNAELILSQTNYSDRLSNNEPTDDWKNIVGLTGLAMGTGVVGYHLSRVHKPSLASSLSTKSNSSSSLLTRISPKLRRELLRLVHNQQTANRLLSGTLNSHPGRSANWVAEKVIYDLKRDR
jgi:hypothetical protein